MRFLNQFLINNDVGSQSIHLDLYRTHPDAVYDQSRRYSAEVKFGIINGDEHHTPHPGINNPQLKNS